MRGHGRLLVEGPDGPVVYVPGRGVVDSAVGLSDVDLGCCSSRVEGTDDIDAMGDQQRRGEE